MGAPDLLDPGGRVAARPGKVAKAKAGASVETYAIIE